MIHLLFTGGTIAMRPDKVAGGNVPALTGGELLKRINGIERISPVRVEDWGPFPSSHLDLGKLWALRERVREILSAPDAPTGIVITHGTDTLEETSYFLSLVTHSDKPVVMVGSMRPATAISADGPGNLYNAVAAAANPGARGRGVLVALNDELHYASNVTKTNTSNVQTFVSLNRGPAALVNTGKVTWFQPMDKKFGSASEFSIDGLTKLPRVDILYAYPNMSVDLIDAAIKNGALGLVVAGVGDGNMTAPALDRLAAAAKSGIVVVRSSRTGSGIVYRNNEVDDDKLGFVATGELTPGKSRVLLQLALTKTKDPRQIQQYFNEY